MDILDEEVKYVSTHNFASAWFVGLLKSNVEISYETEEGFHVEIEIPNTEDYDKATELYFKTMEALKKILELKLDSEIYWRKGIK